MSRRNYDGKRRQRAIFLKMELGARSISRRERSRELPTLHWWNERFFGIGQSTVVPIVNPNLELRVHRDLVRA